MSNICPECGGKYKRLGMHWTGDCSAPDLTQKQKEIIIGLLMGDGHLEQTNRSSRICITMVSKNYLQYIKKRLSDYMKKVRPVKQTELTEKQAYTLRTVACKEFNKFKNWYSTGEKVFPENIELTPTVLKHWYCGDGTWNKERISIKINNEFENQSKLKSYFIDQNLPEPRFSSNKMYFKKEDSTEILDYIGDPLPDFKYKWGLQ
jgi:hypothetical protein